MKKLIVLLAIPSVAVAGPYDVQFLQRNMADTAYLLRVPQVPQVTASGVFGFDGTTKDLYWFTFGSRLQYNMFTHTLDGPPKPDWNAAPGSASEILNKPSVGAQVNSDWNAISGPAQILNKPVLSAVAITGAYTDILGRPTLATVATSGAYSDLSGLPSIPAAQVNSDWNAASGVSQLLNKPATFPPSAHTQAWSTITSTPTTLAGYGITDGVTTSTYTAGLATKFNTPTGTTAQYIRGDGSLATFPSAAVFSFGAPSARTFSLATAYQCTDTSKPCVLTITLQAQSTISLSGASNNEGDIRIGPNSTVATGGGTAIAQYKNNLSGTLVVGLSLGSQQANTYTVPVPTGYFAAIRQTAGTGLQVVSVLEQTASN